MINEKVLTEKLQQILDDRKIAGMSIAVTDREKVIYCQGFGVESIERPYIKHGTETMYRIASISKIFTSTMVMRLVEEGLLNLDTLVKEYFPELKLSRPEALEQLTLKHLLTHTGGLPTDEDYIPDYTCSEEDILNEAIKRFPTIELKSLPEEKINHYANLGFVLAGCVATKVTGKTISQLWREYVLDPLGMNITTSDFFDMASYPMSQPHDYDEDGNLVQLHHHRHNSFYRAGGGLYSNAEDLCKMARFLLNKGVTDSGQRLLQTETVDNMFTKHTIKSIDPGDFYGLGIHIHAFANRFMYGHSGNMHPYNTALFTDQQTGLGVVVLMNSPHSDLRFRIPEMIVEMAGK
ncbi:MAG: beta-lactamase family protein [Firmicutes bacterium]|nr:beta-lactamase family protein [Bacillota bacterium]